MQFFILVNQFNLCFKCTLILYFFIPRISHLSVHNERTAYRLPTSHHNFIIHSHHRRHHSISRLHNRKKSRRGANHPKWQSNISWPEELIDDTPITEMRMIFDLKHSMKPNRTFSPSIPSSVLIWVNNSPSVPPSGAFFISLTRWAMASNEKEWSIDSSLIH